MDAQPATGARKAVDTAFYDLFGLSPDATSAQIKRAYYKRARECHPDKHPNDAVKEAEFKKLSQAYQTLFDEERRAVYDAFGRDGMQSDESYADPRQVFAAVFGGPEFEPWVGVLGAAVDEELQAPLQAAQQRASDNHAKLIALIKARAPADEIEATRAVQRTLQDIEDVALGAVREAAARIQRENVAACSAALEARIAPFVAAQLARDEVDAAARDLAREVFVASITEVWFTLRRCSMGEQMCETLGYAYVRQAQKVRGKQSVGAARLGGLYETARHGMHNLSEGALAVGSAARMAGDSWRLARDAQPGRPEEKRLSEAQRIELTERVRQRTLDLTWAMTKREIESTARAVVDNLLGRGFASSTGGLDGGGGGSGGGGGGEGGGATGAGAGAEEAIAISAAEFDARCEALVIVGGIFSGETPSVVVGKAVDGLSRLTGRATHHASQAA